MFHSAIRVIAELAFLAIVTGLIVYWPELFPRCDMCHKVKPRFRIALHKDISLALTRKGNRSLCKKCSTKERIHSFAELDLCQEVRKRVEYQTRSSFSGTPPHW